MVKALIICLFTYGRGEPVVSLQPQVGIVENESLAADLDLAMAAAQVSDLAT